MIPARPAPPSPSQALSAWAERWLWGAVALVAVIALYRTLSPSIAGLFHDDGVYASVAQALADGRGYRLVNLPGEPYQTKYPPLYSSALAIIWRLHPEFPANIPWLKALNLVFLFATLFGMAVLVRRQNPQTSWAVPAASQVALATTPLVVTFTDFTMTDVPFLALVVGAMLLWGRTPARAAPLREISIVLMSASAIMMRSAGVAISAAIVLDCVLARAWRRAALHGAAAGGVIGTWVLWCAVSRETGSPLTAYYQEYERSAPALAAADPRLAMDIVAGNLMSSWDVLLVAVGPLWLVAWPVLIVLACAGGYGLARAGWRMPLLFGVCHIVLVALHPWSPGRYLLPLVPLFILLLVAGAVAAARLLERFRVRVARVDTITAVAVLASILVGNSVWLQYRFRATDNVRGWYGADMGYRWAGFEETFAWIRRNTPPEAMLAGLFDPMYFLYTDRRGVRPWFHRPETYFYPYGAATPDVGTPGAVVQELRALGVDYIVLDPPAGYTEGPAAIELLRGVIALPEANARLVFTSADGLHEVYRLWDVHR